MAYEAENILIGAADLYIADSGTEVPVAVAADSLRDTLAGDTDFRHLGLTQGGVEFAYSPDFGEVEVDQWLDAARIYKQRQTVTVNTTLAEATLENLLLAWGQAEDTLTGGTLTISAGALGDRPVERTLVFVGNAPTAGIDAEDNAERVFTLNRVINVESSTFGMSRTDPSTIPVSLRALPGSASGGDYGTIVDRTYGPA